MQRPAVFNIHKPVLVKEVLQYWVTDPRGSYLDLTLGCGGHSEALLSAYPEAHSFGVDWDQASLQLASQRLSIFGGRFHGALGNFAHAGETFAAFGRTQFNGILFDLGPSSYQILSRAIGLSYQKDEPLDMRLSPQNSPFTADHLINKLSESELARIFLDLGELPRALTGRFAGAVVRARKQAPLATTNDLVNALKSVSSNHHLWAQAFQALRLLVNRELENLQALLDLLPQWLLPKGHAVAVSFHSLEDRLVKQGFKERRRQGIFRLLVNKPVVASLAEIRENPKARSAKLRAVEYVAV